ncbi:MAG: Fic/DOC family protein [Sciscionella sp.]
MIDPYVDPATGVLRNLLGLTERDLLASAEADITDALVIRLRLRCLPGGYDLAHLQAFHRKIFGDIYPWAGEIRTVDIAKGTSFCPVRNIAAYADEVFSRLKGEGYLWGLPHGTFVDRLAEYYGDVNALHPFREGNGRTQRAFFGQLTRDAGYRIAWEHLEREANIEASVASFRGDNGPLRKLLDALVEGR